MEKTEMKFNLIDEPWIKVLLTDSRTEEVSLRDALVNAHMYRDLAGELPTQDAAMLRLMLAVLHTVFSRVDENGEPSPLTRRNAAKRWEALWKRGSFPAEAIEKYLAEWHERFWLFHPERPFFQVPEAVFNEGQKIKQIRKLNGSISEGDNSARLIVPKSGQSKDDIEIEEAARWLIHMNSYDDRSIRNAKNGRPDIAWCGQLGVIIPSGENLFETLMLNMPFLRDGQEEWGKQNPIWEWENIHTTISKEECLINMPDNPAELYTTQFRRLHLLLDDKSGRVNGFKAERGDYFNNVNSFVEQMTIWQMKDDNYIPGTFNESSQIWREFSSFVSVNSSDRMPGISKWLFKELKYVGSDNLVHYKAVGCKYKKPFMTVLTSVYYDKLTFHLSLLSKADKKWRVGINDEIAVCEKLANTIYNLQRELLLANRDKDESRNKKDDSNTKKAHSKEQFYYRIDGMFREWLQSLDPEKDDINEKMAEWRGKAIKAADSLGRELVKKAGPAAFVGRYVEIDDDGGEEKSNNKGGKKKEKTKKMFYSAPDAFNLFSYRLSKLM